MLYSSIVSKEKNVFHYFPWNIGLYCEDFCAVSYRVLKSRSHIQSLKLISSTLEFIPMTVIFLNQLRIVSLDLCYVFTEYVFVSRFLLETYIPRFQHQYALDAFEGCIKVEVWFEVKRLQKKRRKLASMVVWTWQPASSLPLLRCCHNPIDISSTKKEAKIRVKSLLRRRKKWKE